MIKRFSQYLFVIICFGTSFGPAVLGTQNPVILRNDRNRIKRSTEMCPQDFVCPAVMVPRPTNCGVLGSSVPTCGCFPQCNKDYGAVCGFNVGRCRPGYYCKGQRYERRGQSIQFFDGVCTRRVPTCPEGLACIALFVPPPTDCGALGFSKPSCGCFNQCNKDAGDRCGYRLGNCRPGYYCKDQRYEKRGETFQYFNGVCRRFDGCTQLIEDIVASFYQDLSMTHLTNLIRRIPETCFHRDRPCK